MLEARGLGKTYVSGKDTGRVEAVVDLGFCVAKGEFVAVCGRSGSGKSTLLGMLGGLTRPSRGEVLLDGVNIWSLSRGAMADLRSRRVGFVFQFASLLPTLRAIDNVALPALIAGVADLSKAYAQAEELLDQVGLHDRASAYPSELSGGQHRRVAVVRALVNQPALLLADEPTSDLDEETELEIFELLMHLHRANGTTLVIATHNRKIAQHANRVLQLHQGRLVRDDKRTVLSSQLPNSELYGLSRKRESALVASVAVEPAAPRRPMGAGLGRFLLGLSAWTVVVTLLILAMNHVTAFYQQSRVQEKKSTEKRLLEAAFYQLRADVANLAYGADDTYLLTLSLQNVEPEHDLYVLSPSVRVYVQVGLQWIEVPLRSRDDREGGVHRLTGKHMFEFVFKTDLKQYEELIPGYMHVRFSNAMLVSQNKEPNNGLFERTDDYYVYLKPSKADDAAILRKTKYPGKPPIWIPMPPH